MALPDEVWGRDAYLETVYIVRRNTRCHSAQTPIYRKLGSEPERRGSRVRLRASERAAGFLWGDTVPPFLTPPFSTMQIQKHRVKGGLTKESPRDFI